MYYTIEHHNNFISCTDMNCIIPGVPRVCSTYDYTWNDVKKYINPNPNLEVADRRQWKSEHLFGFIVNNTIDSASECSEAFSILFPHKGIREAEVIRKPLRNDRFFGSFTPGCHLMYERTLRLYPEVNSIYFRGCAGWVHDICICKLGSAPSSFTLYGYPGPPFPPSPPPQLPFPPPPPLPFAPSPSPPVAHGWKLWNYTLSGCSLSETRFDVDGNKYETIRYEDYVNSSHCLYESRNYDCDTICNQHHLMCDDAEFRKKLSELTTTQLVYEAYMEANYTCPNIHGPGHMNHNQVIFESIYALIFQIYSLSGQCFAGHIENPTFIGSDYGCSQASQYNRMLCYCSPLIAPPSEPPHPPPSLLPLSLPLLLICLYMTMTAY